MVVMLPRITQASVLSDYRVHLAFTDGVAGDVDLSDIVARGGVFKPLQDVRYFATLSVDQDAGTIVWPNGVDLDPDVLYERIAGVGLPHERRVVSA